MGQHFRGNFAEDIVPKSESCFLFYTKIRETSQQTFIAKSWNGMLTENAIGKSNRYI